jgi:hypothetical protein
MDGSRLAGGGNELDSPKSQIAAFGASEDEAGAIASGRWS